MIKRQDNDKNGDKLNNVDQEMNRVIDRESNHVGCSESSEINVLFYLSTSLINVYWFLGYTYTQTDRWKCLFFLFRRQTHLLFRVHNLIYYAQQIMSRSYIYGPSRLLFFQPISLGVLHNLFLVKNLCAFGLYICLQVDTNLNNSHRFSVV